MRANAPSVGIDFGTTNTVIALRGGATDPARSVLCFAHGHPPAAGAAAIARYLEDPLAARLIMSMKSYLGQRSFTETRIAGRAWTLEGLVALFLREVLAPHREALAGARVTVGRPVRFVGERADHELAERRLRAACAQAGLDDVRLALEPAAAGQRFAATLHGPATVLVADFGGGTSDFSVLRFDGAEVRALGHAGLGLAGDALDFRIIDHALSPLLGKGTTYEVMGQPMPVPAGWYLSFARWHLLSLMRAPRTLRDIEAVTRTAEHPERLRALLRLIEDEAGYALYQAVAGAKAALSRAEATTIDFAHEGTRLQAEVTRAQFESWIAPELRRIGEAVDAALRDAGSPAVDRVFLTGGTSLVPAIRRLFEARFGAARVAAGGEFTSVAEGLALMGGATPQTPMARRGPGPGP
ncbi:Hsp70 family protein [Roseococcus sp. DSY-14]|uniref:Hsp70 family protein n=1 Tax=Roseococcus sp. DSY-14 TaxID=3369650 RepID=UPI00387A9477